MKKRILLLLLAAVLLLSACRTHKEKTEPEHPFSFYYARTSVTYDTQDGVVCPEQREFDMQTGTLDDLLDAYFEGPETENLQMPFPTDVRIHVYQRDATTVILSANEAYLRLSGIGKSVADACLAKTLFGYGLERVTILASDGTMTTLTQKNLIFSDTGAQVQDISVTLYFADAENRFLLPEQRSTEPLDESVLPEYILRQLIAGPTQRGYESTIPEGTSLLSVKTEDGLCTVDFSAEFLTNSPQTHAQERMTIYSVVNSLTELESVSSVQLLVDGDTVNYFCYMDISEPLVREASMLGPIKSASGEISATLCLYDGKQFLPVTVILPASGNGNEAETILRALIEFAPYNVYQNVIPENTEIRTVSVKNGVCRVELSGESMKTLSSDQLQIAVRSLVCTLCSSDSVDAVLLTADGAPISEEYAGLLVPEDGWLAE